MFTTVNVNFSGWKFSCKWKCTCTYMIMEKKNYAMIN